MYAKVVVSRLSAEWHRSHATQLVVNKSSSTFKKTSSEATRVGKKTSKERVSLTKAMMEKKEETVLVDYVDGKLKVRPLEREREREREREFHDVVKAANSIGLQNEAKGGSFCYYQCRRRAKMAHGHAALTLSPLLFALPLLAFVQCLFHVKPSLLRCLI